MADFMQAIKWLKEGKKVRRKSISNKYWYLFLSKEVGHIGFVFQHHSNSLTPQLWQQSIDMLEANDWEIDKQTLSDKISDEGMYYRGDVKDFIKRQLEFEWPTYFCKERNEDMIPKKRLDEFFEKFAKEAGGKLT